MDQRVDPANGFRVEFCGGHCRTRGRRGRCRRKPVLPQPTSRRGSGSVYRVSYSGAPAISQQPKDTTVAPGEAATAVTATGAAPLAYQWQRDGVDIPGATTHLHAGRPPRRRRCAVPVCRVERRRLRDERERDATVTSNVAPTGTIVSPVQGTTFNAGQTISFDGRYRSGGRCARERVHLGSRLPSQHAHALVHACVQRSQERHVRHSGHGARLPTTSSTGSV